MRRRHVLASLAAVLAGCSLRDGEPAGPTDTLTPAEVPGDTPEPTPSPPDDRTPPDDEDPHRTASVVDLRTEPVTCALRPITIRTRGGTELTAEFTRTATADRPAAVRVRLVNDAESRRTVDLRRLPPFAEPYAIPPGETATGGGPHPDSLVLAPTGRTDLPERVPARTRGPDGTWRLEEPDSGPWFPETVELTAGGYVTPEFALLGHPELTGRPTGTYRWPGPERGLSLSVWRTAAPGPERTSRFVGRRVPALSGEGPTRWFHEADETTSTYLSPSAERVEQPGRVTFELVNHSRDRLEGNSWKLHKLVDGRWFHVTPRAHTAVLRMIPPGGRRRYEVGLRHDERSDGDGIAVGHLGGGTYAFEALFGRRRGTHAALVELEGPPVTVTHTDGANVVDRRDGEVVVRRPEHGDGERPPDARLVVERRDDRQGEVTPRLVAEQVVRRRYRALRDGLASFEPGVERVVVRTDGHAVREALRGEQARQFRFRGTTYEASARQVT